MSTFVADTHSLLWYLFSPDRLGSGALETFETIQGEDLLVIPAVVVAEMVMVVERRRIQATLDELKTVLASLEREAVCFFSPLFAKDVIGSSRLVEIPDIFDRLIVFEALKRNATLITRDLLITQTGLVPTVWEPNIPTMKRAAD